MRARKLGTMALIAAGAALGLWLFAAVLFPLLLPLFIGLGVAELAKKPVGVLQRKSGLPRGLCSFVCVLGLYAAFGAGAFLLCRLLCRQVGGFLHQLPELAGRLEEPAKALQARLYAAQRLARSSMKISFCLPRGFWEGSPIWCSAQ